MTKHKKPRLRVEGDDKRHFISVPQGLASDLHTYLRDNRVQSAPPEPAYTGFDFIELPKTADVAAVQALLNDWV
jgi:hypothetical protein